MSTYTNVTFRVETDAGILLWLSHKFTELTTEEIYFLRDRFRFEQATIDTSDELNPLMTLAEIKIYSNNENITNTL